MTGSRPHVPASTSLAGTTLAHYRVEEQIGAGGMGIVYRAVDTTLKRSVALKLLPDKCAKDPESRARFEREARLLAALNHPHIASIYGFETIESRCFLVLEYVPGETLAEHIARKPLAIPDALRIGLQLAAALESAHRHGIVHRDLKPANVKITPDGTVKVLDFGLAKTFASVAADAAETATLAMADTIPGVVLGTAAYMSPEQARGQPIDKRTDIWAFGCVLFEMLTGRRAFDGATVSDCVAAVLGQEPDWTALPSTMPAALMKVLRRCLQKDINKRLQDIGDVRIEMEEALTGSSEPAVPATGSKRRSGLIAAAGVALGGAIVAAVLLGVTRQRALLPVTKFSIALPAGEVVNPSGLSVRVSQDGSRLAWVSADGAGRSRIYSRGIDQFDGTALDNTAGGASPSFSPDSKWISFTHSATRTIRKIAISGGAAVTVAPFETTSVINWTGPDELMGSVQYPGAIVRITASNGAQQAVTRLDTGKDEKVHARPVLLPGGKALVYVVGGGGMDTWDDARIVAHVLATGERKVIIEGGMGPSYSATGHLLYAREGKLLAVPFDADRLEVTGAPVPVIDGVFMCVNTGSAHYSLGGNGTLAYAPGIVLGGRRELVWVDRNGKEEPIPVPARAFLHPRLSPDDKNLAVEVEGPVHDFWTYDFGRGLMSKVTTEGSSHWPVWTPDGSRLSYRRWLDGYFSMWWLPADRSSAPQRLTDIGRMQSPASWSPDGRVVAFTQVNSGTGPDVFVMDVGERHPRPFTQTRFAEGAPRFSPDGRWIAYTSNESGRNEIYVQQYPGPGAKIQISSGGGTDALWRRKGGELYYRDGDKMMFVRVSLSGALNPSKPEILWTAKYAHGMGSACGPPGTTSSNYDATADGSRFLMIKHEEVAPPRINVIVNWTEELKRALASGRV